MPVYTASNGAIVADLTALRAIPSTDLPLGSNFVVLLVAAENSWYEYNPSLTSGDATPTDNPANGRWIRIGRDKLTANRTYFVRTDGSDSNTGLVNTSGGAFLTIQKAIDVVNGLDLSIYTPTIQLGDGTYTLSSNIQCVGMSTNRIVIQGNAATPSNVVIQSSANWTIAEGLLNVKSGEYLFKDFTIQSPSFGANSMLIGCLLGGKAFYSNLRFGVTVGAHVGAIGGGYIECLGNYSIVDGASRHLWGNLNGSVRCQSVTITLSGTPAFSGTFALADYQGSVVANSCTFVGGATGVRYIADALGQVITLGGANYLPGNVAGSVTNAGQYL